MIGISRFIASATGRRTNDIDRRPRLYPLALILSDQATGCAVIPDDVLLSTSPQQAIDWAQLGQRCGPWVFARTNVSQYLALHSQQQTGSVLISR